MRPDRTIDRPMGKDTRRLGGNTSLDACADQAEQTSRRLSERPAGQSSRQGPGGKSCQGTDDLSGNELWPHGLFRESNDQCQDCASRRIILRGSTWNTATEHQRSNCEQAHARYDYVAARLSTALPIPASAYTLPASLSARVAQAAQRKIYVMFWNGIR